MLMSQMVLHEIGVRKETGVSQVTTIREAIHQLGAWHLEVKTGLISQLYYLRAGFLYKLLNSCLCQLP